MVMMMGMKMMLRMVVVTAEKMEFLRSSQASRGDRVTRETNDIKVNVYAVMCHYWVFGDRESRQMYIRCQTKYCLGSTCL